MKNEHQKQGRLVNRLNRYLDELVAATAEADISAAYRARGRVLELFYGILLKGKKP